MSVCLSVCLSDCLSVTLESVSGQFNGSSWFFWNGGYPRDFVVRADLKPIGGPVPTAHQSQSCSPPSLPLFSLSLPLPPSPPLPPQSGPFKTSYRIRESAVSFSSGRSRILLHCMLAKRIWLQHFWFFGQHCNGWQFLGSKMAPPKVGGPVRPYTSNMPIRPALFVIFTVRMPYLSPNQQRQSNE